MAAMMMTTASPIAPTTMAVSIRIGPSGMRLSDTGFLV